MKDNNLERNEPKPARRMILPTGLLALVASLGVAPMAPAQGGESEKIETARAALEKLVETKRIISKEKRDWALGKEVLLDRISVVKQRIAALRKDIEAAEKSKADVAKKKAELQAEADQLKNATSSLDGIIVKLEARTRALLAQLPEPIVEKAKPLSQDIPEKPEETKLSLSRRFQNVVGVLNLINKFNREITIRPEVRQLGNGTTAQVTAVYVGIGQGFYVTRNADAAGVGTATPEGWKWTPANHAAKEIAKVVAILENEQTAEFVPVPVKIESRSK